MRTIIDVPDELIRSLDVLAGQNNRSRAAEVREAIVRHLKDQSSNDWIRRGAGYWSERTDLGDGLRYQRSMRAERSSD